MDGHGNAHAESILEAIPASDAKKLKRAVRKSRESRQVVHICGHGSDWSASSKKVTGPKTLAMVCGVGPPTSHLPVFDRFQPVRLTMERETLFMVLKES